MKISKPRPVSEAKTMCCSKNGLMPKTTLLLSVFLLFTVLSAGCFAQSGPPNYFDEQMGVPDSSQHIADRIVKSKIPVVVDFWAAWCAPCRMLNPVIAKLEKRYKGRVMFMKVNVDYNRQLAAYLGVQGIPAVFIVKDKAVRRMLVGVQTETAYLTAIEEVLAMEDTGTISPEKRDTVRKNGSVKPKRASPKNPSKI